MIDTSFEFFSDEGDGGGGSGGLDNLDNDDVKFNGHCLSLTNQSSNECNFVDFNSPKLSTSIKHFLHPSINFILAIISKFKEIMLVLMGNMGESRSLIREFYIVINKDKRNDSIFKSHAQQQQQ